MIMQSDKRYQQTKQIMLGTEQMNPFFEPLADFINVEFNVKVVNIIFGYLSAKGEDMLEIWFEFEHEMSSFDENPGRRFSLYDKKKQEMIAEQFRQLADRKQYTVNDIWVNYHAFECDAKAEANESISKKELTALKKELDNKDIWKIVNDFASATFFLYTDKQVTLYQNSPLKKVWADKYFDILEKYNEFGYFKRDTFDIFLDARKHY